MLSRYSTLPSLKLTLNHSRQRWCFIVLLAFIAAIASYHIYIKGYPVLSVTAAIATVFLLSRARVDRSVGSVLLWEHGEWYLDNAGRRTGVLILPTSLRHPLLIYLELREMYSGKRCRLWLFRDSAHPEQLRKLRTRLILDKG